MDELDRCRPSFALELLERIKHLFDVDNLVFVLLVNRDQIENYIKTVYGPSDAQSYLLKFGTIFIDLPNEQVERSLVYVKGHDHYCELLVNHYGLSQRVPNCRYLTTCLVIFARHFSLTLREMERVFGILTFFYGSLPSGGENVNSPEPIVALLSVLKVKQPPLYNSMRKGEISAKSFYDQTKFDMMSVRMGDFSPEYSKEMLECCMMSETEFELAKQSRPMLARIAEGFRNRRLVVRDLCSQLDRFSLALR